MIFMSLTSGMSAVNSWTVRSSVTSIRVENLASTSPTRSLKSLSPICMGFLLSHWIFPSIPNGVDGIFSIAREAAASPVAVRV